LSSELFSRHGLRISDKTVGKLLREHGCSLQAPSKSVEGAQHPDRNAQFERINEKSEDCIKRGIPVISVDTKKKELVGNFKNGGREWQPQGEPELVDVHDFPGDALGKAIPYGVYDVAANDGFVSVGVDVAAAMRSAERASSVSMRSDIAQPTTRREYRSSRTARNNQLSVVAMYVMSPASTRLGARTVKLSSRRLGAMRFVCRESVVFRKRRGVCARSPRTRIIRATRFLLGLDPRRCSARRTRGAPYRPRWLSKTSLTCAASTASSMDRVLGSACSRL
jgi:hypothetical protein